MKRIKRQNIIIVLLGLLTAVTSFSVGFASWTMTGGDNHNISGDIYAEKYTEVEVAVKTFTISSSPSFTALAGKGFLGSSNEFVTSTVLTWNIRFNSNRAKDFISSLSQNRIWMSASLSASSDSSIMANFSVSNMTNTLGTASTIQQNNANTNNSGTYINQQWNITDITFSNSLSFQLSIPLTYTGTISNFPNLTSNKLSLTLLPGEYEDA